MCIWSGWNIVTRIGVTQALSVWDVAFWRFLAAGVLSLPFAWKYRRAIAAVPWRMAAIMIGCSGAPYVLLASVGFSYAPAAHGVLVPCMMALWVALLSWWWQGERFERLRVVGYALLAATLLFRMATHAWHNPQFLLADVFFLAASMSWAVYTLLTRRYPLPPLGAVALMSVGSLVFYCLPYGVTHIAHLQAQPLSHIMLQIIYQGIITGFIALWTYNHAIALIGAARASAYAALIPLLATLMGIAVLDEWPNLLDIVFIALLSSGVLLTTGILRRR